MMAASEWLGPIRSRNADYRIIQPRQILGKIPAHIGKGPRSPFRVPAINHVVVIVVHAFKVSICSVRNSRLSLFGVW